jgi:hypothetical protein
VTLTDYSMHIIYTLQWADQRNVQRKAKYLVPVSVMLVIVSGGNLGCQIWQPVTGVLALPSCWQCLLATWPACVTLTSNQRVILVDVLQA